MGIGRYKYVCDDCQEENWLSSRDRGSRFKPRCTTCGSPWLSPSKASKGSEKAAAALDVSRDRRKIRDQKMNIDRSKKEQ